MCNIIPMFKMFTRTVLFLTILQILNVNAVVYLRPGDACDNLDTERICDPELFSDCINFICGCNATLQFEQPASYVIPKCAVKLGGACTLADSSKPGCIINSNCVTESEEEQNGICACVDPDHPSPNNDFCYHVASNVSEFCGELMPGVTCNEEEKLYCSASRCSCESGWITTSSGCYANYDFRCKTESNHTWELCPPNGVGEYHMKCSGEEGRCECLFPEDNVYVPEPNGTLGFPGCYIRPETLCREMENSYGMHCVEASNCVGSENAVCKCVQYFAPDEERMLCAHHPEELLEHGADCASSYPRAVCNYNKNLECNYPCSECRCTCTAGLLFNELTNACQASSHESECQVGSSYQNMTCNSEAFLKCEESKCVCENEDKQYFSNREQQCQLLVHENCTNQPESIPCTTGSTCQHVEGDVSLCRCQVGRKSNENRTECITNPDQILLSYNQTCNIWDIETSICFYTKYLVCLESICTCPTAGHVWNPSRQYCFVGYGSACDLSSGEAQAQCNPESLTTCLNDICVCRSGETWLKDLCHTLVGQRCYPGSSVCVEHSSCVGTVCACDEGFIPNPESNLEFCIVAEGTGTGSSDRNISQLTFLSIAVIVAILNIFG